MYRILKALLLVVMFAGGALAEEPAHTGGCEGGATTAYSVALNNTAIGTASSSIDLGANAGIFVRSTGTANTQLSYQFSDDNSIWDAGATIAHKNWCIKRRGRYIRFIGSGTSGGTVTAKYQVYAGPATNASVTNFPTPLPTPAGGFASQDTLSAINTALSGWESISQTTLSGLSPNAQVSFNLTATALSSVYRAYAVRINVESPGATSMRAVLVHSVTAPETFGKDDGPQYFPLDGPKFVGPALEAVHPLSGVVPHLHLIPTALNGATSATVFLEFLGLR